MTLLIESDTTEHGVAGQSVPPLRHHSPMQAWEAWRHLSAVAWPGREDVLRLRPQTRWLLLGLGGWAAGTSILAAVTILWPSSAAMPEPAPSLGASQAQDYAAITERPLFARTRHPAAVPVFVPPAPPPRDHAINLKGVFLNGTEARAFLTSGAEPQGRWLAMNGTIAGWTIASLTPDEVRLEADGERLTVSLHPAGQSAGAPASRPVMPLLPQPFPSAAFPTNGGPVEPGLRPNFPQMKGAAMPGVLGMGAKGAVKAP